MTGWGNGIKVVASHDLDALLHELAGRLAVPGGGSRLESSFEPEVVVVPSKEARTYLLRELSRHLGSTGRNDGVVANFLFVYPRQLVYATTGELPEWPDVRAVLGVGSSEWDLPSLTWIVDDVLRTENPEYITVRGRAPLAAARRVAELFDHYISHRPAMVREWLSPGVEATRRDRLIRETQQWQVKVFECVVRALTASRSLCALAPEEAQARFADAAKLGMLPSRISVFGVVGLSRAAREYLDAIARHVDVAAYVVHGASHNWPALRPSDGETRDEFAARLAALPERASAHPLHGRWCASSIEQAALLGVDPTVIGDIGNGDGSLLSEMKADIVRDAGRPVERLDDQQLTEALRDGDGSVQVHACYGALRQAEALRDSLLRLMRDTPGLKLRDIAIATADPDQAAPILAAVLDPHSDVVATGALPRLPLSVSGSSSESRAPLAEAFFAVIRLASSRCSPGEMLEVLAMPHVSRCFGLDSEALETIADWVESTGVRHGLDPGHRLTVSDVPGHVTATTWLDALRRVALGAAVPAPNNEPGPGGIIPLDSVSSGGLQTFGALAEFVSRLSILATNLSVKEGITVGRWVSTSRSVLVDFLAPTDDDIEDLSHLRSALANEEARASANGTSGGATDRGVVYPVADLAANLRSALPDEFHSYSTPWESILVTTLEGLAHRPRDVVVVYGANEEMFAGGSADGDNILANNVEVGEPNYSMTGRQNFLHAMMTAKRALIVTCDGADVSTNKVTPLAVPVREFLEVAAATLRGRRARGGHPVLVSHPRQNYHEQNLTAGKVVPGEPFTFDRAAPFANALVRGRVAVGADSVPRVAEVAPPTMTVDPSLADVTRAVRNPLEYHLGSVLGVELPPVEDGSGHGDSPIDGDGIIALSLDALAASAEGRDLLETLARNTTGDVAAALDAWKRNRPLTGLLPPGVIGESIVLMVSEEVSSMLEVLPVEVRDLAASEDVKQVVKVGARTMSVHVPSVSNIAPALVRLRYKRFADSILVDAWIELAALTLARGGEVNHVAHVVARPSDSSKKGKSTPVYRTLEIIGTDRDERLLNAATVLETALGIHRAATLDRIPLFERASRARARVLVPTKVVAGGKPKSARKAFEDDVSGSAAVRFLLDGSGWDEVRSEMLTPLERSLFGADGNESRFDFYADLLWGTFERTCRCVDPAAATPGDGTTRGGAKSAEEADDD